MNKSDKGKILSLSKRLIRLRSTANNPKQLDEAVQLCASYLKRAGLLVYQYKKNNKPSLVALTKKTKRPDLLLVGHLDVVDADSSQFIPQIKNGKLFGRGASDMKSLVAAMMVVIEQIFKDNSNKNIGLMLTTDEEIGGADGVGFLLGDKGFRPGCAFIPDSGDNWKLIIEEKGILHIKLTAKGKSAHGSRPWQGVNAIDKVFSAYLKLRKYFPEARKEKWSETMNLGKVIGGESVNKIPDKAEIYLDFRFTSRHSQEGLYRKIKKIVGREVKVEKIAGGDVNVCGRRSKCVNDFYVFASNFLQRKIETEKAHGASDGRYFGALGIPSIIIKPRCGNTHGRNEWIDINDLLKFYQLLLSFLRDVI